ncbi:regulator of G-protein signaling 7-like isoform X2 [Haliotis cracherodii]|uniref:regulator of G-protein signaling 7-like isoform X2 n=1 Tax=Haliotis cracherodii TaxID=6455 RepID=UPI0039E9BE50
MTINSGTINMDRNHKPRHMVFSKMEKLILEMQNPKTGVPVKCQKTFLSTIPSVFTGYDLITWLRHHLNISEEDVGEALHLAQLLCQYGYFFPITDNKNLVVKGDISLYRFQCPFYWASHNTEPDNVTYAIHLTKRSMRNKQKHGLEDYEQNVYSKLQKMLCDKWETIQTQAQDQVRIAKDRKRTDKVITDSQERAFWRIHRPPPGHIRGVEGGPKRYFMISQMDDRRKNKNFLEKQVRYLRNAVNRCRMKTLKAIESYAHRHEQYQDNDSFLTAVLPSNPWISEDTTFWEHCDDYIENPTERRVKKWAYSFHELLSDYVGREEFEKFLKKEYSHENIRFWKACEDLKFCPHSKVAVMIDRIYDEFLNPGSAHEINIDGKTMEIVQQNLKKEKPDRFTFEAAQEHIFLLMKKDSYARFLRSEQYKSLLANALQPGNKKKLLSSSMFFNFGSRKKTLTPSPQPKRRSSAGNDFADGAGSVAQHSYSTGNLRELDDKAVVMRREQNSSDSSLSRWYISSETSPTRKSEIGLLDSPRRSKQLEVPKHLSLHMSGERSRGEPSSCLAITVPSKTNIVAPWEGPQ